MEATAILMRNFQATKYLVMSKRFGNELTNAVNSYGISGRINNKCTRPSQQI